MAYGMAQGLGCSIKPLHGWAPFTMINGFPSRKKGTGWVVQSSRCTTEHQSLVPPFTMINGFPSRKKGKDLVKGTCPLQIVEGSSLATRQSFLFVFLPCLAHLCPCKKFKACEGFKVIHLSRIKCTCQDLVSWPEFLYGDFDFDFD